MTLEELIEELRENVLRDSSDAVGNASDDYLFDDRTLVRYIQEAVTKFAVETLCIRDETTPEVTRIRLVPGVDSYALDPRVIALYGARIGNNHLQRVMYSSLVGGRLGRTCTPSTTPSLFYTDRESGKMGVWPVPGEACADQDLILRAARKPLRPLEATNLKAEPELPEEYHLDVLEWAAYRALRNHDADAEAMTKASAHRRRFTETVQELSRKSKRLLAQDIQFRVDANWS